METEIRMTDRKRTMIFINIVITCIASSMLATALTTALPAIISDLEISVTAGQWLTSGYSLAMGIIMPLTAFLITRFPTKRLFLTGMLLFIVGLSLCVVAPDFQVMMAARILQACGNGILTSMAQVIILTIYPAEKRGTAMGWYGLSIGAAPVIAPTLAGIIVDMFGWRAIFYISIGIMMISLVWAVFVFDNILETARKKFDTLSFVFSIFAFGGLTLGIGNIGSYSFMSAQILPVLVIGLCASGLFVYRQLHFREAVPGAADPEKEKLCDQRGGKYAFIFCDDGILHADAALRTVYYGMLSHRFRADRLARFSGDGCHQPICGENL